MSPLARPVLALAAAATLLAACAASPAYRPNKQDKVYPGKCSAVLRGQETIVKIYQTPVTLQPGASVVDVEDSCWWKDLSLVGEKVTACSTLVAPVVKLDDWPKYSPAIVSSQDDSTRVITVYVEQYCSDA